jgi:hypothetical protein
MGRLANVFDVEIVVSAHGLNALADRQRIEPRQSGARHEIAERFPRRNSFGRRTLISGRS